MSRKPTTRSDRLAMERCLRDLLQKKAQRIAELEEQLKNAIVPKFKIYQHLWFIDIFDIDNNSSQWGNGEGSKNIEKRVRECFIASISQVGRETFLYRTCPLYSTEFEQEHGEICFYCENSFYDNQLFATKAEAQAKLEELKGENK